MCFSSDIAGPSHPSLADGRVVSLYGKQLHICAFVPCVFYVWSCTCTAARLQLQRARRHRVAWALGSGSQDSRLKATSVSPFAICHPHSPFAIPGARLPRLRDKTGLRREPGRCKPPPPCHWSPLNRRHRHPHPGPPPARSCSAVECGLLCSLLWVALRCGSPEPLLRVLGLHLSGWLSAFPRHRQPALEPLHLCALHLLGTVFLPCLSIDIYLA